LGRAHPFKYYITAALCLTSGEQGCAICKAISSEIKYLNNTLGNIIGQCDQCAFASRKITRRFNNRNYGIGAGDDGPSTGDEGCDKYSDAMC